MVSRKAFHKHNTPNLEADGLQQQKTISCSTQVSQEEESEVKLKSQESCSCHSKCVWDHIFFSILMLVVKINMLFDRYKADEPLIMLTFLDVTQLWVSVLTAPCHRVTGLRVVPGGEKMGVATITSGTGIMLLHARSVNMWRSSSGKDV